MNNEVIILAVSDIVTCANHYRIFIRLIICNDYPRAPMIKSEKVHRIEDKLQIFPFDIDIIHAGTLLYLYLRVY